MSIVDLMRKAASFNGAPVGERQALLSAGADTIDALVAALEAAKLRIEGINSMDFKALEEIDAALALARGGK